jgi:hypothetical protein
MSRKAPSAARAAESFIGVHTFMIDEVILRRVGNIAQGFSDFLPTAS